jgi:hypothetical protein
VGRSVIWANVIGVDVAYVNPGFFNEWTALDAFSTAPWEGIEWGFVGKMGRQRAVGKPRPNKTKREKNDKSHVPSPGDRHGQT